MQLVYIQLSNCPKRLIQSIGMKLMPTLVMNETKKSFEQLEQKQIKVNRLITDSASENAATR